MFEKISEFKNSQEWINFEEYYDNSSFLEQIKFFRYEDVHTNFLASMLKPDNIYNLKDYPLRLLIELIVSKSKNTFDDLELLDEYNLSDIRVATQYKINSGRLDLYLEFQLNTKKYYIILEAKLSDFERNEQCKKYREELGTDKNKIYIFLSLLKEPEISDNSYIKITYQDLIDKIFVPCTYKIQQNKHIHTINEYLRGFNYLYELTDDQINLIPILPEGKNLTIKLWQKYQAFLIELLSDQNSFISLYKTNGKTLRILFINLYNIADQININKSDLTGMNKIFKTIKRNRLRDTFYNSPDFVYMVFSDIIQNHKVKTLEDIKPILTLEEVGLRTLIPASEIEKEKPGYYRTTPLRGKEVLTIAGVKYAYLYCSEEGILMFIDLIKDNYSEYSNLIERI